MKFIADVMLGKLARRLRLLGFDVLYDPSYDDNEVIRIGLELDRIILTRDRGLAARPLAERHVLVLPDRVREQIQQIFEDLSISSAPGLFTRCSRCNGPMKKVSRRDVRDLVPEHVYATHTDFRYCTSCGKAYWRGSHVTGMAFPGRAERRASSGRDPH